MRRIRRLFLLGLVLLASLVTALMGGQLFRMSPVEANSGLLRPAPTQPLGFYDYFGQLLSPEAMGQLVSSKGLNPRDPNAYQKLGAVKITQQLIDQGENIFLNRELGDFFGLQAVLGFGTGLQQILPEVGVAISELQGQPTSNLKIKLLKNLPLGSRVFPAGTVIPTGLDVEKNAGFPIGLKPSGDTTCAICHVALAPNGDKLKGAPNGDLAVQILIALAPNSAAGFARLGFNPLDPKYKGNGKVIINSQGEPVELPDPIKFETAFDDAVLAVPFGHFESSPDGISNTTQIPTVFTFKSGPYTAGGEFAVGPFAGLSAVNNGVHSSEINLLAAAQLSAETLGLDPEVYLGTVLQNAAVPELQVPNGVKPSEWLRAIAKDPKMAELQDQIAAPGTGTYPKLKPSLFTYNGLIFSPDTADQQDIASGRFLFAANAMSAWQNSLTPPPNRSPENQLALSSGSVQKGAAVFEKAKCATCHVPPFFTDNKIHPIAEIKANSARAESRLGLSGLLVPPKMYSLDTQVPPPPNANVIDIPTTGISKTPTTLPQGLLPNGGYKTPSLRGLYVSAPYLHDGGVAVRQGALLPGTAQVLDPNGLGLPATLVQNIPADPASSLRALLDRTLRGYVIFVNQVYRGLLKDQLKVIDVNLTGEGHEFYVDPIAGFSLQEQTDLINFLLALDDKPGEF